MKRCTGIEFLNQCEYAVLCENGFGCKYEGECDYQRPKITAHNSDYAKCPNCGSSAGTYSMGERCISCHEEI